MNRQMLDTFCPRATVRARDRLGKILPLVLLALWLPVTLHCQLEAADLWPEHDDHADTACCTPQQGCMTDACGVLEGDALRNADTFTRAPLPVPFVCLCLICFRPAEPVILAAPAPELAVSRQALAWVPTWHFARRAAPWSGAPSLILA